MKVTVKSSNDQAFQVTVPDNSTVGDLKVAAVVALPPDSGVNKSKVKVWYSGKKMELSKSLESYGITQNSNSTVYLTCIDESSSALSDDESAVVEQPKTKVRRKSSKKSNKCSFESCNSAPLRMVGDCSFCNGKFCSKHRLLESHKCKGLQSCKEKSYERNALKLQSEQTVASKV
ncbi:hypothetical protein KL921_003956 [Ogataea angusta]|uniref:AN1-type zinc finger protein n=1 Tax=Pichia angusta TaxID=870730 RepID=A0AAN6I405_PICAN|nr:uncharacterized protein KL928_004380 [Ogataea angusta]KAG7807661.1 hypothetical protein KL921_003956 [Ogataea angusta]KAG7816916.1 hypothetical protein KL928_004380 [Ogataea angusta]KAG7823335.1 hypothetical protein KL909_003358 [Ogataea angusta]KAG7828379.1 hypothetical protein KL920_003516 [Ogataea angusta]KAG7838013.1 hypothetical protein KL943_000089 [Ogataea angusta]